MCCSVLCISCFRAPAHPDEDALQNCSSWGFAICDITTSARAPSNPHGILVQSGRCRCCGACSNELRMAVVQSGGKMMFSFFGPNIGRVCLASCAFRNSLVLQATVLVPIIVQSDGILEVAFQMQLSGRSLSLWHVANENWPAG